MTVQNAQQFNFSEDRVSSIHKITPLLAIASGLATGYAIGSRVTAYFHNSKYPSNQISDMWIDSMDTAMKATLIADAAIIGLSGIHTLIRSCFASSAMRDSICGKLGEPETIIKTTLAALGVTVIIGAGCSQDIYSAITTAGTFFYWWNH